MGYIERAVVYSIHEKLCKSVNDIAELKAVCDWYWPSIETPEYLTKDRSDTRIFQAIKKANADWKDELEEEKRKGNVYIDNDDDSDSSQIYGKWHP